MLAPSGRIWEGKTLLLLTQFAQVIGVIAKPSQTRAFGIMCRCPWLTLTGWMGEQDPAGRPADTFSGSRDFLMITSVATTAFRSWPHSRS